ncbi:MAG: HAD family phosphatase [Phycisphaerales bacterium]|nr:HAD family phosphatase [Phycisphaerales bacterium]
MPERRYDLLALDLDGTTFDPAGRITQATIAAISRARAAGVRITVCTGRGLVECEDALGRIGQTDPVVVAGGSITACPVTRRTLHRFAMDSAIVSRAVELFIRHGHPALVLKDPLDAGFDYLVVVGEEKLDLDPVTLWWFSKMKVEVRFVPSLADDGHPEHTVRAGVCGLSGTLAGIKGDLDRELGERAVVHHFPAVVAPEHERRSGDGQTLHVLEVFDKDATKWSAVSRLARQWGIEPSRIAAIGDEVNDIAMLKGAGLGIAMGNAVPAARAAAKRQTKSNAEDGVAWAVGKILDGEW